MVHGSRFWAVNLFNVGTMTQEEILCHLYELRDLYKKEKINAATREYNIYYAGSVDAIEKAIKKIKS